MEFEFDLENKNVITAQRLQSYVSAEPFRPFRISMASGQFLDIKHPEMIMVGRSSAKIYKSSDSDPEGPPLWEEVLLMLTESLEPLETKASERIN